MEREGPSGRGLVRGRRGRIVVADDELEMRTLLSVALSRVGYEVLEASDGWDLMSLLLREAFASPDQAAIDLLLVDITMPGCSGLQVLADTAGRSWRPTIVMITGNSDPEVHRQARQLGAAAVLRKPIDLEELRSLVAQLVGKRADRDDSAQALAAAPAG